MSLSLPYSGKNATCTEVALPCDEQVSAHFITEVLQEVEDHRLPTGLPEPFHEDFRNGSFAWDAQEEGRAEKLWPMGPITALNHGRIWPVALLQLVR